MWYDTPLQDWVVRLPVHGGTDGPVVPLELPWFDTPWTLVHRAAADVAYAADVLVDDDVHDD